MEYDQKASGDNCGFASYRLACRDIVGYEMPKEFDTAVDEAESFDCD